MYNFDKLTDRTGTSSLKWAVKDGELPMWVADMDFEVCPAITAAIEKRIKKPVFGYNIIPDEWYNAYINWWDKRHGLKIKKDWLMFSTGVVPSISSIVRRLTLPAEKVVIQTPVYNIFFNSIYNNGRYIEENPLQYSDGVYSMDFAGLEQKLADPQTTLMILCNPHNPVGKNWDRATLEKVGELCHKHNVKVISDEIHCDVQKPGCAYVPFASVSAKCRDVSVTLIAPTKAFNIAGMQTSAIVVPNPALRQKVYRGINNDEIAEPNTFAVATAIAAFEEGGQWLDEMNAYVDGNRQSVKKFLATELPDLSLVDGEATYLLWVDCSKICNDSVKLTEYIRSRTGLFLTDGAEYGKSGASFFRMNVACPRSRVEDGLARLKSAIQAFVYENIYAE